MKMKRISWRWVCILFLICVLGVGVSVTAAQPVQVSAAAKKNGFYKEGNQKYYNVNGRRVTGWKTIKKKQYYFQPDKNGAMATGFLVIQGKKYCFTSTGKMYTKGWHKINGRYYCMTKDGYAKTGWYKENKKQYYLRKSGTYMGAAVVGTYTMGSRIRTFNSRGVLVKTKKLPVQVSQEGLQPSTGTKTIRNFLLEALRPVGKTKYVLGGGWDQATATSKSVPENLDCSGFVGWASYQLMGRPGGCVAKSYSIPSTYKNWGWGTTRSHNKLKKNNFKGQFQAGDIVKIMHDPAHPSSSTGHVWIVIGQCSDGSYVLVHASPPCAQIAGTPTPDNRVGEAIQLAQTYMKRYYQGTVKKYNIAGINTWATDLYSYMTQSSISSFRWSSSTLKDPDNFAKKDAAAILKSLYGE